MSMADTAQVAIPTAAPRLADLGLIQKASRVSPLVIRGLMRAGEFAASTLLGFVIALVYVAEFADFGESGYALALLATSAATVVIFEFLGLYTMPSLIGAIRQMPRVLFGWTLAFGMLVAAVFFMKLAHEFSRVWLLTWYCGGAVILIAGRLALAGILRHWMRQGRMCRRAVIYGANFVTGDIISQLERDADTDIRIAGIFDDRDGDRAPPQIAGYPRLGRLKDLVSLARSTRIDLVLVALPITAERRLIEILKLVSVLPADIKMPAKVTQLHFSHRTYSHIGSVAMIDMVDKPIADWGTVSKWLFDKFVATAAIIGLSPVMLAVALAIKLDSRGPVLFRQKRYGFNNELIEVFKFRSMYTDRCDAAAAKLVTKDDPRVTKVGRFIRKTSLDELPQLFNVVIGNLSLVGPRPHAMQAKAANHLYDEVVDGYFARHKVKPGITGWAQIHGWRGETDTREKIEKRVEHDLYYIDNWSVLLDAYILIRTPLSMLKSENAY